MRRGILFFYWLILSFFSNVNLFAQTQLRQDIVPHSPEAEAMAKFVSTPVTLYSGSPNISIPVYEIKSSRLSLPVSLNYNYKGYRPGEEASCVGLGWSLSGGGGITRIIKGQLDNNEYLQLANNGAINGNYDDYVDVNALSQNQNYLQQSALGFADTEPDLYIFNFNGYSGKFILIKGRAIMYPHQDLSIDQNGIDGPFTITTPDGTAYHFNETETTYSGLVQGVPWIPQHTSAWFLSSIVSADKTDTITLTYQTYNFYQRAALSEKYTVTNATGSPGYNTVDHAFTKTYGTGSHISSKQLYQINSKTAIVTFNPETTGRLDLPQSENKALKSIVITNATTGSTIKKFSLVHNYFANLNNGQNISQYAKLNLKEVDISSFEGSPAVETPISKYQMDYANEGSQFPTNTEGIDLYGYYNGADGNASLYPNGFVTPSLPVTGNRNPNFGYCSYGILNKITYPTGGFSTFQYEGNQFTRTIPGTENHLTAYLSQSYNPDLGDPSVSSYPESFSIVEAQDVTLTYGRSFDHDLYPNGVHNWVPIVKLYKIIEGVANLIYSGALLGLNLESNSTTLSLSPGDYKMYVSCESTSLNVHASLTYYLSSAAYQSNYDGPGLRIKQINSFDNINFSVPALTIMYDYNNAQGISNAVQLSWPTIGEKSVDHINGDGTLIEHSYLADYNSSLNGLMDEQFYYSEVSEITSSINKGGKTVYDYGSYDNDATGVYLTGQKDYKYSGSNFLPLRTIANSYDFVTKSLINVFKPELTAIHVPGSSTGTLDGTYLINPDFDDPYNRDKIYTAGSLYPLASRYKLLKTTVETNYDQNGQSPMTSQTDYTYDNPLHQFPTKKVQTNSKGEQLITEMKYPLDYALGCTSPIETENAFEVARQNALNTYYSATQARTNALSNSRFGDGDLHPYYPNTDTKQSHFTTIVAEHPCEANFKVASDVIFTSRNSAYNNCHYDPFAGSEQGNALSWMQTSHVISPVIEQYSILKKAGTEYLLSATKTNYSMAGVGASFAAVPQTILQTELQAPLVKSSFLASPDNYYKGQASFSYDSHINLAEQHKTNDVSSAYIWDYKSMYPIAEVVNASASDIAYTSFEAEGSGGFTFSGSGTADASAPTGSKSYSFTGSAITRSINTSKTYIVSLWSKNGAAQVNGLPASIVGNTINGWTYMEWKISNAASVSIFGSGVSIDELRLYPAEAQMSSFTYLPAIGITSKCDINNRISYYLYDGSGRLQYVLDEHRNILKKIGYNYAGQPENSSPGTVFWNNFYTTTIQRSDCGSGYAGETVTYTVPAHTLSSTVSQLDADKKTLADAATNGQAYANTHGSCQLVAPQVTSINYVGVSGFKVVYTNTSTNQQYSFPISDTSGTKILGTVPAGVYNVVISKTGNTTTYGLGVTNNSCIYSLTYSNSATFYNINVSTSSCNRVMIDSLD